jgi:hypothetical protein
MKKLGILFFFIACVLGFVFGNSHVADAINFNQNNLIGDAVFDNANTMSTNQIDAFLNQFPGSCISTDNGFQAVDPTGYSPTGGFTYGGNVSAGQIIYDASQAYGINPQVLLTTIEKEQSLVTGSQGCSTLRYTAAAGYGCPDGGSTYSYSNLNLYTINGAVVSSVNGTCVNTALKAGFSQQIIRAAWLLKFGEQRSEGNINWAVIKGNWDNSDDPESCYSGPMTQGTYQVCPSGAITYYDGYFTIDNTSVHMDDGATAALYWYTPHFEGNQNFDTIFSSWFGTLYQLYTWTTISENAYYDSSMQHPVSLGALGPSQRYYLTVTVQNTGNVTWLNYGANPVDLGTVGPQDRSSPFCDPTWVNPSPSCNRPATLHEYSVAPGQYGSFSFWITTPSTVGNYNEIFAPVMEGVTWMNESTVSFPMIVNPGTYSMSTVGQYAWTDSTKTSNADIRHLVPGRRYYISVALKNTGDMVWTRLGSNPFDLGTVGPQDRSSPFCDPTWPGCNRPAILHEYNVYPGQTGSFEFWITTPSTGDYSENFNPVAEGVTWASGQPEAFNLEVVPYTWGSSQPHIYTDSTMQAPVNSGSLNPGQRYFVSIDVTNTGYVGWQSQGANHVALGTANAFDHSSPFCDPTWPGCNRPAILHEYNVYPGQTGSFEFWITTPSTAGNYNESFTPLVEGLTWMGTSTINLPITVSQPVYSWSVINQSAYTSSTKQTTMNLGQLKASQRYYLTVTVQNTGNVTWLNYGANPVDLGTVGPQDRSSPFCDPTWVNPSPSCNRPATLHEYSVAPGQYGSFSFWITTPSTVGNYNEIFAPVMEGVTWMNESTVSFPMIVQ